MIAAVMLATGASALLAQAVQPTEAYDLDKAVSFNVLDEVEYDGQSGKLVLIGHNDARYHTSSIPYFDYLAAFLEHPAPKFSFEWTADSESRVNALRNQPDGQWQNLARGWGIWLDSDGSLTAAGRFFMPRFGISVTDQMDRYQILSAVFAAANEPQRAGIIMTLRDIHLAWPHPSPDQLAAFVSATGVYDYIGQLNQQVAQGTLAPERRTQLAFRAIWNSMDNIFGLTQRPLLHSYDAAVQNGQSADVAFDAAVAEFNRQLGPVSGAALRSLFQSKSEIDVPASLISPSLRDTLFVQPHYIDVSGNSLLAKLLYEADYAAKSLVNMPELTARIPRYQTEFGFRLSHPAAALGTRVATARLWISVDHVDAARSPDGNVLGLKGAVMRINMRDTGGDAQLDQYARLLSSLYDDLAQHYSPLFHELREAAKLAYAARWLHSKNAALKMPPSGRGRWNSPAAARGIIFVTWSPKSATDVITTSAIGGVDLTAPTPPPLMPTDADVIAALDLSGAPGVREKSVILSPGNGFPELLQKMVRAGGLSREEDEDEERKCEQGAPVVGIPPPEPANYPVRGRYGERALKYFHPGGDDRERLNVLNPGIFQGMPRGVGSLVRLPDLVWQGICMEAKEGFTTTITSRVQLEILKDKFLIARQLCSRAEWHFFVSPTTKQCGPDGLLVRQLRLLNIRCVKHEDPRVVAAFPNCRPQ